MQVFLLKMPTMMEISSKARRCYAYDDDNVRIINEMNWNKSSE